MLSQIFRNYSKPSILRSALVLVLIPFVVNSIWIALLLGTLEKIQRAADREHQMALVVDQLNAVNESFFSALSEIYSFAVTGKPTFQTKSKDAVYKTRQNIAQLNSLLSNANETRTLCAHFDELVNEMEGQLMTVGTPQPGEDYRAFLGKVSVLRKLLHKVRQDNDEVQSALASFKDRLEGFRRANKEALGAAQKLTILGLAGNFLLAIALLMSFIQNFSKRMAVLISNASLLPKRQPLENKVAGGDELAYLDDSMHTASHELIQAWNHRDSLIAMVAHDLRSPLNSCEISLELIENGDNEQIPANALSQLKNVRSNIRRLLGLIKDLLTIHNLEGGELTLDKKEFEISSVVDMSLMTLQSLADAKKIQIINDCTNELVLADQDRIVQVLINYLSNAIKFSPKNSKITVFCTTESKGLVVSVRDEGCGLNESEAAKVFDKFFQAKTDQSVKGFGLGLAICKLIVEAHGGKVGVESRPKEGSRFWFSTPSHLRSSVKADLN